MIDTYEGAQKALADAMSDAVGDNPEVGEDDIAHDVVLSVCWECTDEVAAELCRREIGWVPDEIKRRLQGQSVLTLDDMPEDW